MLHGKNVILCVTGSIAAYKSAFLVRLLIKAGANVKVVMTQAAKDFITPLTLGTLSKNPVLTDFAKDYDKGVWNNHVDLGIWGDLMVVAPATANTIASMAHGEAATFMLATYLSARCPVYLAPAMDLDMYQHGSTRDNLKLLESRGNYIIKPGTGELASGLSGEGRLAEPEEIIDYLEKSLRKGLPLDGKKLLISAGPTHEAIDAVRYIGNRSSGKMGYALAEVARDMGAEVTLISGPTALAPLNGIKTVSVVSAQEMYEACNQHYPECDVLIMSAAVADYTPQHVSSEKIKKQEGEFSVQLKRTTDILRELGEKKQDQFMVGFAMETAGNGLDYAKEKLVSKNLDMIVFNSLNEKGAGFQSDSNKVTIIHKDNKLVNFELKPKQEVARDILNEIVSTL